MIVDSQVHIWGADTPERPWPVPPAGLKAVPVHNNGIPFTQEHVLGEMNVAGVDRAIIVPPSWEGDRNDLALAAAAAHPDRFAVMGRLDIQRGDATEQIRTWLQQPGMLGLRFALHTPLLERPFVSGELDWVWREAEASCVPDMILVPHRLMPSVAGVAERHPGLKLVMDHLGLVLGKDDEAFAGIGKLLELARYPNVAAKASITPFFTTDAYQFRNLHEPLRRVFDAFGPKRMFWGSDLSRLPCPYRQGVTMFTQELSWLDGEDLDWVMGRGVCEWLGWPVQPAGVR
jgi:predicted TIM-barrel fold metal-dependent hydrolase